MCPASSRKTSASTLLCNELVECHLWGSSRGILREFVAAVGQGVEVWWRATDEVRAQARAKVLCSQRILLLPS